MTEFTIAIPTWAMWALIGGLYALVVLEAITIRLRWKIWKLRNHGEKG